jgi:hypothetical protein
MSAAFSISNGHAALADCRALESSVTNNATDTLGIAVSYAFAVAGTRAMRTERARPVATIYSRGTLWLILRGR